MVLSLPPGLRQLVLREIRRSCPQRGCPGPSDLSHRAGVVCGVTASPMSSAETGRRLVTVGRTGRGSRPAGARPRARGDQDSDRRCHRPRLSPRARRSCPGHRRTPRPGPCAIPRQPGERCRWAAADLGGPSTAPCAYGRDRPHCPSSSHRGAGCSSGRFRRVRHGTWPAELLICRSIPVRWAQVEGGSVPNGCRICGRPGSQLRSWHSWWRS